MLKKFRNYIFLYTCTKTFGVCKCLALFTWFTNMKLALLQQQTLVSYKDLTNHLKISIQAVHITLFIPQHLYLNICNNLDFITSQVSLLDFQLAVFSKQYIFILTPNSPPYNFIPCSQFCCTQMQCRINLLSYPYLFSKHLLSTQFIALHITCQRLLKRLKNDYRCF